MNKPKIVICNDDGIDAPGIYHLWNSLKDVADLTIVAPAEDQSCKGVGISLPKSRFIDAEQIAWKEAGVPAWKVFGTPADCTRFALHYLMKETPALIVSGINNGSNAGRNIMYSGTVGAVIQATFCNVPGIAFSCMWDEGPEKFQKVEPFIPAIVSHFLEHPLPKGTLMNVNFPGQPAKEMQGMRFARQGQSYWDARIGSDPSLKGSTKYPILDTWDLHEEHAESDIYLLTQGFITCSPIHVHDLTDHKHREEHKPLFEEINKKFSFLEVSDVE